MCETERQAEMELIEFLKFTEQDDCDKYNMLQQSACEIRSLEKENQQLKEVVEKVREISNDLYNIIYNYNYEKFGLSREQYKNKFKKLLQILDKVKEN